eukprot:TRINITY_DN48025_c0_g1_i1.p1 TRINITY_DN48025_c0_g1~~TRINITY_DN48025_c0_g1_i1.p1  ORF type:complete len:283 (+),score=89.19 TRINITY_DN48025_c0_g1_i1:64-849(+)
MPGVAAPLYRSLLRAARRADADAVLRRELLRIPLPVLQAARCGDCRTAALHPALRVALSGGGGLEPQHGDPEAPADGLPPLWLTRWVRAAFRSGGALGGLEAGFACLHAYDALRTRLARGCPPAPRPAGAELDGLPDVRAPVPAVLACNGRFYEAFAAGDPDAMEQVWADGAGASCVHPGCAPVRGRAAVTDSWRRVLLRRPCSLLLDDLSVCVYGTAAAVQCVEVFSWLGGRASRVAATNLFARTPRGWRIAHHHGSHIS